MTAALSALVVCDGRVSICCGANTTSTPHKRNAASGSDVRDKRWQLITQGLQSFLHTKTPHCPGQPIFAGLGLCLRTGDHCSGADGNECSTQAFTLLVRMRREGWGRADALRERAVTFFFLPLTAALHKRRGLSFQGNVLKLGSLLLAFDLDGTQKISRWQRSALRQVQYITKTDSGRYGNETRGCKPSAKVLGCTCVVPPEK